MQLAKWKPDDATAQCDYCERRFDLFHRRHHCRLCGGLFCYSCSNLFLPWDVIVQRWNEKNGNGNSTTTMTSHISSSEGGLDAVKRNNKNSPAATESKHVTTSVTSVLQRVCVHCFEDVQLHQKSPRTSWENTPNMGGCILTDSTGTGSGDTVNGDGWKSLLGGREHKICVILLQGNNNVGESGERTDLSEVFHALEEITHQAQASPSLKHTSSKDTTSSLGSFVSSVSELSGSEKNIFTDSTERRKEGGVAASTAPRRSQHSANRHLSSSSSAPRRCRKKVLLQLPIPLYNTSDSAMDSSTTTTCTTSTTTDVATRLPVRAQLLGITHRHGFDKALLQQHTIGTDAYIIILDGEPVSPLDMNTLPAAAFAGGNGGIIGNGACIPHTSATAATSSPFGGGNSLSSFFVSIFPTSTDGPEELSSDIGIPPPMTSIYDRPFTSKGMESARGVWEAIGRYGGDVPICAVIDSTTVGGRGSGMEHEALMGLTGCGNNQQTLVGGLNYRCHKDKQQKTISTEAQALALHKALLLLAGEVIRRDMARRDG